MVKLKDQLQRLPQLPSRPLPLLLSASSKQLRVRVKTLDCFCWLCRAILHQRSVSELCASTAPGNTARMGARAVGFVLMEKAIFSAESVVGAAIIFASTIKRSKLVSRVQKKLSASTEIRGCLVQPVLRREPLYVSTDHNVRSVAEGQASVCIESASVTAKIAVVRRFASTAR